MTDRYNPALRALPRYDAKDHHWKIKLDANESTANLPEEVRRAVAARVAALPFNRYPDMGMLKLRQMIGRDFKMTAQQVLLGNGSSEILEKLFYAFGGPGRSVVYPSPSFSMYPIYAALTGSRPAAVELEDDFSLDAAKLLAAARQSDAKLVVVCTPNNPTGNALPMREIEKIAANAPCPVVVDEAYVEFYGQSAFYLVHKYPNLIVARTLSKAYCFASARLGYMLAAPEIVEMVGRTCMPFYISALTLAAGGAVYQNRDLFVPHIRAVTAERARMAAALAQTPGIRVYPSETNFLLIELSAARLLHARLAETGIGVRYFGGEPRLKNCLRLSLGAAAENTAVLRTITAFMREEKTWNEQRS